MIKDFAPDGLGSHVRLHLVRLILNFQITGAGNVEPSLICLYLVLLITEEESIKVPYLSPPFLPLHQAFSIWDLASTMALWCTPFFQPLTFLILHTANRFLFLPRDLDQSLPEDLFWILIAYRISSKVLSTCSQHLRLKCFSNLISHDFSLPIMYSWH